MRQEILSASGLLSIVVLMLLSTVFATVQLRQLPMVEQAMGIEHRAGHAAH